VRLPTTPEFAHERDRFAFVFSCEACGHFDRARDACRHGYPIDEHRAIPAGAQELVFCKEFELD
jgi:hypothetical protein